MNDDVPRFIIDLYEEWSRGDFSASGWAAEDIEFTAIDGTTPGTWIGPAQMAWAWRQILDAWQGFTTYAEGFQVLDDGRILVLTRNSGRGKASGFDLAEMQTRGANVLTIEDGKVTKLAAYWNRDNAYADLGIEPE